MQMKYVLKFSGEHPSLPLAELAGVLEGEGFGHEVLEDFGGGQVLVDVGSDDHSFVRRLALTTKACEYVGEGSDLNYLAEQVHARIGSCKSFAVRCDSERLERSFGELLHGKGLKVSLKKPEFEVNLFKAREKYLAGLNIPLERNFNERRAQHRPFFSPTSMHPKLARVMVNLARVKRGDSVLDPFCGTGGILIEAGLVGMRLYGWDISDRMTGGCVQNLRHYGLKGEIKEQDSLNYAGSFKADAVVTDLPYGRASYTTDRKIGRLYADFLLKAKNLAKVGGYVVMMIPQEHHIDASGLDAKGSYDIKVHRSLTRRIWVLKNPT